MAYSGWFSAPQFFYMLYFYSLRHRLFRLAPLISKVLFIKYFNLGGGGIHPGFLSVYGRYTHG